MVMDCLASLHKERSDFRDFSVVVADNHSQDESVALLCEFVEKMQWRDWVKVLPLPRNGGFAYGNNRAIKQVLRSSDGPDYIWLLNPDTLVLPGALSSLVRFFDLNARVGLVGSRLEDPDGRVLVSAFRWHSIIGEFLYGIRMDIMFRLLQPWCVPISSVPDTPCPVNWVSGASLMIRRVLFESVGSLDEEFFMYFEETDYCRRAWARGWQCCYVPESRVVHLEGGATPGVGKDRKRRPGYWFESRRRYFLKHHGRFYLFWADIAMMSGYLMWRIRRRIQRKEDHDPAHFLADFFRHSIFMRGGRM